MEAIVKRHDAMPTFDAWARSAKRQRQNGKSGTGDFPTQPGRLNARTGTA